MTLKRSSSANYANYFKLLDQYTLYFYLYIIENAQAKAYSDTIKKHLSGMLEYGKVKVFHPPML